MKGQFAISRKDGTPAVLNTQKLVETILELDYNETAWRSECVVITDYTPPFPLKDTRPKCVISHPPNELFLRHSCGPRQGYFWDAYGDDFINPELAIAALSQAQKPWGKPYVKFRIPLSPKKETP